jgi:hypothetical protein
MDHETVDEIKRHFNEVADGLRSENADLKQHFNLFAEELRSENADLRRDFNALAVELRLENADLKRHFNVVAEGLRSEIRIVAEGLQGFREETAGEFRAVRGEISEVGALMRLSFGDLDRRLRALET